MLRIIIFAAGVAVGIAAAQGGAAPLDRLAFPDAAAAPAAEVQQWRLEPAQPMKSPTRKFHGQRCASGFKEAPDGSSYSCSNSTMVRCPGGGQPANVRFYRQGNDPAGTTMLIFDCPQRQRITPVCDKGYAAGQLQFYRSGNAPGFAPILLYQCIRYRLGTER